MRVSLSMAVVVVRPLGRCVEYAPGVVARPVSQYFTGPHNSRASSLHGRRYWVAAMHCRLVTGVNDGIVQHYFVQNQLTEALPACPWVRLWWRIVLNL
jgi:hypothetical protein